MRWILLLVAILGVWSSLAITYWRQTGAGADLSGGTVFSIVFLAPLSIFTVIYGTYRFFRWRKQEREREAEAAKNAEQTTLPSTEDPALAWLQVHYAAVQTPFGTDSSTIIEKLQAFISATTDSELGNSDDPIISRRIDLKIAERDLFMLPSDRAIRIQAITDLLLNDLDPVLALMSEKMAFGQRMMMPIGGSQQVAVLHPAWQGKDYTPEAPVKDNKAAPSSWSSLILQVGFLIPDHVDSDDQQRIQNLIDEHVEQYDFNAERLNVSYHIVKDADDTLIQINRSTGALAHLKQPQLLLLIGADSTLDQQWLDQQHRAHTPAEAGFAILLSNEITLLPELSTIAHVSTPISAMRQKPMSSLGHIGADTLRALLAELGRLYKIPSTSLVPETGILLTDTNVISKPHTQELSQLTEMLGIDADQVTYVGLALENANTLISGVTLVLGLQHVQQSKLHTLVLNNGGEAVRNVWLALTKES